MTLSGPRPLSTFENVELALLQLGLALLAAYFTMGVTTKMAYAWPLLVGPGPFFPLLCVYLCAQLQRRTPHLYRLVCFVTLYSVPYAGIALIRGHAATDTGALHLGDLPPLMLALTLVLRLHGWRRLFDAPVEDDWRAGRALLVELFGGVGAWSMVLCGLCFLEPVQDWARASVTPGDDLGSAVYAHILLQLMFVPALVAAIIGLGPHIGRAANGWVTAALVFVMIMTAVHFAMALFFVEDLWSRLSAASWTLVLVVFAVRVNVLRRANPCGARHGCSNMGIAIPLCPLTCCGQRPDPLDWA